MCVRYLGDIIRLPATIYFVSLAGLLCPNMFVFPKLPPYILFVLCHTMFVPLIVPWDLLSQRLSEEAQQRPFLPPREPWMTFSVSCMPRTMWARALLVETLTLVWVGLMPPWHHLHGK